jgi:HlyD family secretion protein
MCCGAPRWRSPSLASCASPKSAWHPRSGGQLAAIKFHKGDRVRAGDVVAELSAIEMTTSVGQARAALAAATADRNNVYAGVRAEQIASLAAEIAKAKSRLQYAEQQLGRTATLARSAPG